MHRTRPFRRSALGLLVGLDLALRVEAACAGGGAAVDAYDEIKPGAAIDVHSLADVYAQANLDAPSSRSTPLRAFDGPSERPSIAFVGLTVAHAPELVGFRIDASVGNEANGFLAYDPGRTAHPDLARGLSFLEQAFVTIVAPLPRPISVDVGKFNTPVGLEDNESLANWNYTRGLLFTLAEPTYHTGVRATVTPVRGIALTAFWLNGWNTNVYGGDGMRSLGVAATLAPTAGVELSFEYVGGLERAPTRLSNPTLTFRNELDVSATYRVSSRVSVAATADYGGDAANGGVRWWGTGGYVRAEALPWLAAIVRGEHYADPEGFMTGVGQAVDEATATLEGSWRPSPFIVKGRLEYRRDQSGARVFASGLRHDDTVAVSAVVAF